MVAQPKKIDWSDDIDRLLIRRGDNPSQVHREFRKEERALAEDMANLVHERAAVALQQKDLQIMALESRITNLKSIMVAAAEEIQEHWQAHCDKEGYGPSNLMHRLETGLGSGYTGYKAGAFAKVEQMKALLQQTDEILRGVEDFAHGEYGKAITQFRGKIQELLNLI